MREIKFRGIAWATSDFVFGDLYGDQRFIDGSPCVDVKIIRDDVHQDFIVTEETIGQFTGLKDKNSVEIYEGDIVKLNMIQHEKGGWRGNEKAQGVVEFNDVWGVRFVCKDFTQRTADCHWKTKSNTGREVNHILVVGNIHQNPEILEQK